MFTLVANGTVHDPAPRGQADILIAGGRIVSIGTVDRDALDRLAVPVTYVDAAGLIVAPGFVDPHAHLIGAAGEQGFASRTGPVTIAELRAAGVTTVVGCLGTDTVTRTLPALIGAVQQIRAEGLSAYCYTGGFPVPPQTLTGTIRGDLVLVECIVGVGEIAISDPRSSMPSTDELRRIASDVSVGGMISGKAGVLHLHVGPSDSRLAPLRDLVSVSDLPTSRIYPTHVHRSDALLDEAIDLARSGAFVDIDTVELDTADWIARYFNRGGPADRLTLSSDAHTKGADHAGYHRTIVAAAQAAGLAAILPLVTSNPACALALSAKGRLAPGADGDCVLLDPATLAVRGVIAGGVPSIVHEEHCS